MHRFVVAPPQDTTWPPTPAWSAEVTAVAREWRDSIGVADGLIPGDVRNLWSQLVRRRAVTLTDVRHGHDPTLWTALVTLHAVADEACRGLASRRRSALGGLEREAWDLLARHGSLSTINPSRVKVTPKTHLPQGGITIRSLSRYLALTYESVELGWHRVKVVRRPSSHDRRSLVIVLPERRWWEAIGLPPRTIEVIDLDGGTFAPLICEDLARLDEVSDLLRRIGPSLVVGLLLDGPQLADRWAGRHAAALADDPGSAVLTLTSLGMARRSHAPGLGRSRVVAMWADRATGRRDTRDEVLTSRAVRP